MDIVKITNNTKAKKSRDARPLGAFMDLYSSTEKALTEVAELNASDATKKTLLKSHVINTVTAVEVYYRDMLDSVFRLCKPSSFEDKLKKLHDRSYKIDDLLDMYIHKIHPLELVASSLSFQNIHNIDKTFTILIGKPFFKQAKQIKWRLADQPKTESEISHSDIQALQDLFDERHQLIHNPNIDFSTSINEIENKIDSVLGVIMASDLVMIQFINENLDPEVASNKSEEPIKNPQANS